jgi:hypothetical protein
VNVTGEELHLTLLVEHEVVGNGLVVGEEIALDEMSLMAEAENEVPVAEVCVVLHHVPQDGAAPDGNERLRKGLASFPHPQAKTSAEENDLHKITSIRHITNTSRLRFPTVPDASIAVPGSRGQVEQDADPIAQGGE